MDQGAGGGSSGDETGELKGDQGRRSVSTIRQLPSTAVTRTFSPGSAGPPRALHSPSPLQLKFQTFGGAKIDVEAVQATYLRTPNVDLTPRIKPFVTVGGIDVPAAELPPGEHILRVDIKDSDGRSGTATFVLKVEH